MITQFAIILFVVLVFVIVIGGSYIQNLRNKNNVLTQGCELMWDTICNLRCEIDELRRKENDNINNL